MRAGSCHARDRSNGWTLRCSCLADYLGPYIVVLELGWRSPRGLRHFFWGCVSEIETSSSCKNTYGARVVTALLHSTV
jgi:hypothetical protein